MRAVAHNPEDCRGARLGVLELAALLGRHSWRDEKRGEGGGGGLDGGGRCAEEGEQASFLYLSETMAYASPAATGTSRVTRDASPILIRFLIPHATQSLSLHLRSISGRGLLTPLLLLRAINPLKRSTSPNPCWDGVERG